MNYKGGYGDKEAKSFIKAVKNQMKEENELMKNFRKKYRTEILQRRYERVKKKVDKKDGKQVKKWRVD